MGSVEAAAARNRDRPPKFDEAGDAHTTNRTPAPRPPPLHDAVQRPFDVLATDAPQSSGRGRSWVRMMLAPAQLGVGTDAGRCATQRGSTPDCTDLVSRQDGAD